MGSAAQLAFEYAIQAFPNAAPTFLREIISKYSGTIVLAGAGLCATCITPLWEYIYDRLLAHDPDAIAITASYKKIPENTTLEDRTRLDEKPPNGYSLHDKEIINEILQNAKDQRPKEQMKIHDKKGTLDDAKADFKKLGDGSDGKEKKPNVWVKELSNGKTATVRVESTDEEAEATFEIRTTVKTTDGKSFSLPIVKVRYYK
ncbi:unnamed protein product [Rotaria sordida]|uniref:Uncharacterized protein n=1 Tax=Rotaria sordida TaxID=392033 RepID=A0A815VXB6_9BILA|nr:unnamed protein product [Rotaria sordida]CAF1541186.1 unnamed protein product [Rotaria sordida]CAF4043748.1 unnamed protein product [Rotaria sordida]CAF4165250.1 unnamed protein product [Rotaria sordida]